MGEFGFGQSFELQTKQDNRSLIDAVTATTHKAGAYLQYPKLQYLQLDRLLYRKGLWMREEYLQLMGPVGIWFTNLSSKSTSLAIIMGLMCSSGGGKHLERKFSRREWWRYCPRNRVLSVQVLLRSFPVAVSQLLG